MRRKKLTFDEFVKKFDYHSFSETAFSNEKTGKFVYGYKYYLRTNLTDEQKVFLEQFKNIKIGNTNYRYYSKYISYDYIFIGNSCF